MPDPTIFEAQLADAFDRYVAPAPTTVDPRAVARSAAAGTLRAGSRSARLWRVSQLRLAIVLALIALVAAAAILLAGATRQPSPGPIGGGGRIFAWLGTGQKAGSGAVVALDGVTTPAARQDTNGVCPVLVADLDALAGAGGLGLGIQPIDGRGTTIHWGVMQNYAGFERWSPDGRRVALVDVDHAVTIDTPAPDGTVSPNRIEIAGITAADWSDDSSQLAVAMVRHGTLTLRIIDAATGSVSTLPDVALPGASSAGTGVVIGIRWAQDGRRVAVVVESSDSSRAPSDALATVDLANGPLSVPTAVSMGGLGGGRVERLGGWSPDGKQILASTTDSLLAVDAATGAVEVIATGVQQGRLEPRWSPDGDRIAFVDGSDLVLIGRDGLEQGRTRLPGTGDIAWSPDGRVVAVVDPGRPSGSADSATASMWLYRPWDSTPASLLSTFARASDPGAADRPPCVTWQPSAAPDPPSPSTTPSTPASPDATSTGTAPAAEVLRSVWRAEAPDVRALGGGSHPGIALVIDASGTRGWLFQDLSGGPWINDPNLRSSVLGQVASGGTDEVTFVVEAQDTGNCKTEGRYRWEVSPDGQALTLTTVSDLCTVRRAFLERRWTRSTEQLP